MVSPPTANKPCYEAGDHSGMTEIFHLIIIYILATICIIEIFLGLVLTVREMPRRKKRLKKFKIFMVPLILTDFLIGSVFVPLFVLELSKDGTDVECDVSVPRVLMYIYYYVTRTMGLAYICVLTRRKTKQMVKTPTQRTNADSFTYVINISVLWSPGISALLCFGFSSVETNSILALFTLGYFILTMTSTSACHYMVYRAIRRDKEYEDNMTFMDTKYYREALRYVTLSFVCFAAINIPLFISAIVFVGHTFFPDHSSESRVLQDLYLVSIALAAIQAIGNPLLFISKLNKVRKGLCKTCSIIIFKKQTKYRKSFSIQLIETKWKKERKLAALAAAENIRDAELNRGDSARGDSANSDRGMFFGNRNNVMLDEAGIEIEHDGIFNGNTTDITLGVETHADATSALPATREVMFEHAEPDVFGDWRNHVMSDN